MSALGLIVIVLLIFFLIGAVPTEGYGRGHGVSGGLVTVLIIVLILAVLGVI